MTFDEAMRKARNSWRGMRQRCNGTSNRYSRHHYYGRGISVCPQWQDSFEAFLHDVGLPPSPRHSIDRIDTVGDYEPGNVRWATQSEQNRNRSRYRWHRARLTPSDVRAIMVGRKAGMLVEDLAEMFGTTAQNIGNIISGRSWAHLTGNSRAESTRARASA